MPPRYATRLEDRERELFRGRAEELALVRDALAEPLPRAERRVLMFTGVGGIGKSALARRILRDLQDDLATPQGWLQGSAPAFAAIDLAEANATQNVIETLLQIRLQLGLTFKEARFPIFDFAFARIHAERFPSSSALSQYGMLNPDGAVVRRCRGLVPASLQESSHLDMIADGINQLIEDIPLINSAYRYINHATQKLGRKLDERRLELLRDIGHRGADQIERRLPRCLGVDIQNAIENAGIPRRVAIVCDSLESFHRDRSPSGGIDAFAREDWLRNLVWHSPGVVFLFLGREPHEWATYEDRPRPWAEIVQHHPLRELSDSEIGEILLAFPVPDAEIRMVMIAGAAGLPFYLGLQLDIYADLLEDEIEPKTDHFADKPAKVLARFRDHVGPTVVNALRTLAHARRFDRELFDHLKQHHYSLIGDALLPELTKFSFVERESGADDSAERHQVYRLHQHYQDLEREELGKLDQEHGRAIDNALFAYWDARAQPEDIRAVSASHEAAFVEARFHIGHVDPKDLVAWAFRRYRPFMDAARYGLVLDCWQEAAQVAEKAYGPDHPEVAKTLGNLGVVQQLLGDFEAARQAQQRALGINEKAYGPDHPEVATTLGNLGNVQQLLGDFEAARQAQQRALDIEEKAYGPDHPEVAATLGNLGIVQRQLGDFEAARQAQQRALDIKEKAYGDHPEVAATLGNLGIVQQQLGDFEAARLAQQRALGIKERAYGPDHPEVAKTLGNLGNVQQQLGDFEAARQAQQRALGINEKAYGTDHPQVAKTLGNLGNVQQQLGDFEAARQAQQRALGINEKAYGPDHPEVAITLTNLGNVQQLLGDFEAARQAQQRALGINEKAYGPDHPEVAITLTNLGIVQRQLGDFEAARQAQQRALDIKEKAYGPDHPEVAATLGNLGNVQRQLGDFEAARQAQQRALDIEEKAYGPDHPQVATTLTNLGIVQQQLGDLDAARQAQQRALDIKEKAYGPDHPEVAITLGNLGNVQRQLGDFEAARQSYQRALRIFETKLGPDHPHTQLTRQLLSEL